jgi:hypothetical protein
VTTPHRPTAILLRHLTSPFPGGTGSTGVTTEATGAVRVMGPVVPMSTRGISSPRDRRTSSQYHEYHHAVAPGTTTIPRSPTRTTCPPQGVEAARGIEKSDCVSGRLGHG